MRNILLKIHICFYWSGYLTLVSVIPVTIFLNQCLNSFSISLPLMQTVIIKADWLQGIALLFLCWGSGIWLIESWTSVLVLLCLLLPTTWTEIVWNVPNILITLPRLNTAFQHISFLSTSFLPPDPHSQQQKLLENQRHSKQHKSIDKNQQSC